MKKLITLILSLFFVLTSASIAQAQSQLPPCVNEDGSRQAEDGSYYYEDCYWDAQTRGNKVGQSFFLVDGVVTPTNGQPVVQECTEGYALAEDGSCLPLGYWDDITLTDTDPIDILTEDHTGTPVPELAPATPAQAEATAYVPVEASPAPVSAYADTLTPAQREAQAWAQWDAVSAASLLPDYSTRVAFIGHNKTGFPNLTANLITVWDMQGNYYLFQIS